MTNEQIAWAVEVLSRHALGGRADWRASFDGEGCRGVYAGPNVVEPAVAVAMAERLEATTPVFIGDPDPGQPSTPIAPDPDSHPGSDPRFVWDGDDPGPLIGGA